MSVRLQVQSFKQYSPHKPKQHTNQTDEDPNEINRIIRTAKEERNWYKYFWNIILHGLRI